MANPAPAPAGGTYMSVDFDMARDFAKFHELHDLSAKLKGLIQELITFNVSQSNDDQFVQGWQQRLGQVFPIVQSNVDNVQKLLDDQGQKGTAIVGNISAANQLNTAIA